MLILATVLIPGSAFADLVLPANGYWVSWTPQQNSPDGSFFWNKVTSWDGTDCNIGYVLTGQATNCGSEVGTLPSGVGALPFWAANSAGTSDVSKLYFQAQGPAEDIMLQVQFAGNAGPNGNALYFYQTNAAGTAMVNMTKVFQGDYSGPVTVDIPVATGEYFGFRLAGPGNSEIFNSTVQGNQFALFREEPTVNEGNEITTYWIGVEDLPVASSDADYQDMVFSVTMDPVPEASVLLVLGAYLCVLLFGGILSRRNWPACLNAIPARRNLL